VGDNFGESDKFLEAFSNRHIFSDKSLHFIFSGEVAENNFPKIFSLLQEIFILSALGKQMRHHTTNIQNICIENYV